MRTFATIAAVVACAALGGCQRDRQTGPQRPDRAAAAPIDGPVQVAQHGDWKFFPPPPELIVESLRLVEQNPQTRLMFGRLTMSPLNAARRGLGEFGEPLDANMAGVLLATLRAVPVSQTLSPDGGTLRLRLDGTKADAAMIIDWSYHRERLIIESLQVENVETAERIQIVTTVTRRARDGA